jgi:phage-related protein
VANQQAVGRSSGSGALGGRSTHDKIEYRVIFMLDGRSMVLLHGFTKNSAKTKKADIDLANKRRATWEKNR